MGVKIIDLDGGRKVDQSMCFVNGKPDDRLFMEHPEAWCHEGQLAVKNTGIKHKGSETMWGFGFMKPNDANVYNYEDGSVLHKYANYDETLAAGWIVD